MDDSNLTEIQKAMFADTFNFLVKRNEQAINRAYYFQEDFIYGPYCEFLFSLSRSLKLRVETSFLAIELFNNFMNTHLDEIMTDQVDNFEDIFEQVEKQVSLRILSCLQLATKAVEKERTVTAVDVRTILSKQGLKFHIGSILRSELRVWKTIGYSVIIPTVADFIDFICTFLSKCKLHENENELSLKLKQISFQLLQLVFICRPYFYKMLYCSVTGKETIASTDAQLFARLTCDNLLLTVGVVCLSVFLFDSKLYPLVLQKLNILTSFPKEDIAAVVENIEKLIYLDVPH